MELKVRSFTVRKRFALKISRGTTVQSTNIWLTIKEDEIEGFGEASPFSIGKPEGQNTELILSEFKRIVPQLELFKPWQRQEIEELLERQQICSSVRAAIDMALYDWLGKKVNLPLWQLWGLNIDGIVPISATIGISSPSEAVARAKDWQNTIDPQVFKIKLGSPSGIEADRKMFLAIKQAVPNCQLTVDANGGWNLDEAIEMCHWLADYDVLYVEQPLPTGGDDLLLALKNQSPLPIFVDESCCNSRDIPRLAGAISGINIKIMKAGGLTEAIKSIHIAKAFGLKIMFGCYSDSTLANTAMSHLAPLADYLDLDSHLNLIDDPFIGATIEQGKLLPNNLPGLGVEYGASSS